MELYSCGAALLRYVLNRSWRTKAIKLPSWPDTIHNDTIPTFLCNVSLSLQQNPPCPLQIFLPLFPSLLSGICYFVTIGADINNLVPLQPEPDSDSDSVLPRGIYHLSTPGIVRNLKKCTWVIFFFNCGIQLAAPLWEVNCNLLSSS